jgi:uncharacterized protein (AIM24 family)
VKKGFLFSLLGLMFFLMSHQPFGFSQIRDDEGLASYYRLECVVGSLERAIHTNMDLWAKKNYEWDHDRGYGWECDGTIAAVFENESKATEFFDKQGTSIYDSSIPAQGYYSYRQPYLLKDSDGRVIMQEGYIKAFGADSISMDASIWLRKGRVVVNFKVWSLTHQDAMNWLNFLAEGFAKYANGFYLFRPYLPIEKFSIETISDQRIFNSENFDIGAWDEFDELAEVFFDVVQVSVVDSAGKELDGYITTDWGRDGAWKILFRSGHWDGGAITFLKSRQNVRLKVSYLNKIIGISNAFSIIPNYRLEVEGLGADNYLPSLDDWHTIEIKLLDEHDQLAPVNGNVWVSSERFVEIDSDIVPLINGNAITKIRVQSNATNADDFFLDVNCFIGGAHYERSESWFMAYGTNVLMKPVFYAGGLANDALNKISVDPEGDVISSGQYEGGIKVGGTNIPAIGGSDVIIFSDVSGESKDADAIVGVSDGNDNITDMVGGWDDDPNWWYNDIPGYVPEGRAITCVVDYGETWLRTKVKKDSLFSPPDSRRGIGLKRAMVAYFSKNSQLLWSRVPQPSTWGYPESKALSCTMDYDGNVYATGSFEGEILFMGIDSANTWRYVASHASDQNAFIIKFSPEGEILWGKQYGECLGFDESGTKLKLDKDGNIILAGQFNGDIPLGDFTARHIHDEDFFIAKLSSEGVIIWVKTFGGNWSDKIKDMVIDRDGNIYFTGTFDTSVTLGNKTFSSSSGIDFFVAKMNKNGDIIWAHQPKTNYGRGRANALALDAFGNVYLTGAYFYDIAFGNTVLEIPFAYKVLENVFVASYSQAGEPRWAYQLGGELNDEGLDIWTTAEGICYVAGKYESSVQIGTTQMTSNGGSDMFVGKIVPPVKYLHVGYAEPRQPISLSLFPNPVMKSFVLILDATYEAHCSISISDIRGVTVKKVMEGDLSAGNQALQIDMEGQASGVYFLQILTPCGLILRKLVKT